MTLSAHRRLLVVLWGILGVLLVALTAAVTALLWNGRSDALAQGEARVKRFAAGAEVGMNRALLSLDVLLASTEEMLHADTSGRASFDAVGVSGLLRGAARQNLMLRYVALLDETGALLAASVPREGLRSVSLPTGFLAAAMSQAVPTLIVSQPQMSALSSERVLYVARPLRLDDGTPLLAVAQVPVEALVSVLLQGQGVPEIEVTFERTQGQLLLGVDASQGAAEPVRLAAPALHEEAARANLADAWLAPARLSGEPATVFARPLLYQDLWVTASLPQALALTGWRDGAVTVLAGAVLLGVSLILAGVFATLYSRRMHHARQVEARSKALLDQVVDAMVSGFMLLDARFCIAQWNQRFEEMFPWLQGTLAVGLPFRRVFETMVHYHLPGAHAQDKRDWVRARMARQRNPKGTVELRLPDGHIVQVTERATPDGGLVIICHDVTDLRQAAAEIEHLAFYDQLTGLPNRRMLLDQLGKACAGAERAGTLGAVLFIDLDNFKTLNDTLGHETGDLFLKQVARRLVASVRAGDLVARLGGDEFVVVLASLPADAVQAALQARSVAQKILHLLARPYQIAGQTHHGSCSVGAALFGQVPQTAAEVLKQADIAMYQVKTNRGNSVCFFDPAMQVAINRRARLEADLQAALDADQFLLHLQPQFSQGGTMMGAEALIRWQHPERGLVPPAQFIGVAEDGELIVPMGRWVLRTACQLLARWQGQEGLSTLSLSVNVSARQFRQPDFVDLVLQQLQHTGAPAHRLELELTESLVLEDVQDSIAKMHQLRTKGVRFALDDFGTGYSSLAYLTRLPLHRLKIDQSFVHHLGERHIDDVVVQTILGMARNLELEVVAEGVETQAQRDFLAQHGCDMYQGYLFARPMPVDEFEALCTAPAVPLP
ncbi:bifunctional diguanylate cyclase/phosphodiesterase [Diaphorobacter sp.]|uniref:bifunctional diguanylate cyclase/phosphodiesterase n=1 Tax=Diaphorobacter sp. TaxID=1934310 RepID=UPI003D0B540A